MHVRMGVREEVTDRLVQLESEVTYFMLSIAHFEVIGNVATFGLHCNQPTIIEYIPVAPTDAAKDRKILLDLERTGIASGGLDHTAEHVRNPFVASLPKTLSAESLRKDPFSSGRAMRVQFSKQTIDPG